MNIEFPSVISSAKSASKCDCRNLGGFMPGRSVREFFYGLCFKYLMRPLSSFHCIVVVQSDATAGTFDMK